MPHRDSAPVGAPCWVDLFTSDPEKSRIFYSELFGWTVEDPGPDYGGYVNFHEGRRARRGLHAQRRRIRHARCLVGVPRH